MNDIEEMKESLKFLEKVLSNETKLNVYNQVHSLKLGGPTIDEYFKNFNSNFVQKNLSSKSITRSFIIDTSQAKLLRNEWNEYKLKIEQNSLHVSIVINCETPHLENNNPRNVLNFKNSDTMEMELEEIYA